MPDDPALDCTEIQGDSVAGFRKDYATFLFFRFDQDAAAPMCRWVMDVADRLSYADAVLQFNHEFRVARVSIGEDPDMAATWMNLAFTADGMHKLVPGSAVDSMDTNFLLGGAQDAGYVGDPTDGSPGDPQTWVVGGPNSPADGVLIIAADHLQDKDDAVAKVIAELQSALPSGAIDFHQEDGNTRPDLRGHEHFGFKDGISQPGIRGRVNSDTGPYVTDRLLDASDPRAATFSAPGQVLCWPGTFIVGAPRKRTGSTNPDDVVTDAVPSWLKNGSYIAYRRLQQDASGFHDFLRDQSSALSSDANFTGLTEDRLGALLVGRWASGTPVARKPDADDEPGLQKDIYAQNNFIFDQDSVAPIYDSTLALPADTYAMAKADPSGITCPFAAHIRKVNPRDDVTDQGNSVRTLEHRILRRGIPYGAPFDPNVNGSDTEDRGLQFVCYQASIADGFRFLANQWANNADAPHATSGIDPIIGTGPKLESNLATAAGGTVTVPLPKRFITTTGAAYLFAPSRSALKSGFSDARAAG